MSSVIFLAKQALNGLFATSAFVARSITNYTVASPSDLTIFGKPIGKQIAYDGYCTNIEAFICATSLKKRVNCDLNHYPIDASHIVTVPIPLPRTVFALREKPTPENEKKMLEFGKDMGLEKLELGKGNVYTIDRPTIDFLVKIRKVAPDNCTGVTDYSQLGATIHFYWLTQCVDLFLATNTYSYRPSDMETSAEGTAASAHPWVSLEYRSNAEWTNGCDKEVPAKKRKITDSWEYSAVVDAETERGYDSAVGSAHAVFVAKPSPLPSKTSWGLPADCPNSEGIHFPYFEGLHHSDVGFTRRMVTLHFFRNLGSSAKGPREAFQEFRSQIGPAMSTPSGRAMNHILYGIDLALGTQTQLYLLFDKTKYYGFNLLGGYFSVWAGTWIEPSSATELQVEMAKYRSHDAAMKALTKFFKETKVFYTDPSKLPKVALKTSQQVVKVLGLIDQEKTEDDVLKQIEDNVGNLVFDGSYRTMNGDNLETAINELLGNSTCHPTALVYVPSVRTAWKMLSSPFYPTIGSFGARSFSLRDRGGKSEDMAITSATFKEKLAENDKDKKRVRSSLPFYEKPCNDCVVDWTQLVTTGKGRFNFSERAIGSRGFLVKGAELKSIVEAFEKAKADKIIGVGAGQGDKKGKKKAGEDVVMGETVSLGDLF